MPMHRLRSLMHLSHRLNGKDPATWTLWSTAYFCNCTRTYTVPRNRNGNRIGDLLSQSWLPHTSRVSILEMLSARIVRSFLRIFCSLVYDRCREFAWVWRTCGKLDGENNEFQGKIAPRKRILSLKFTRGLCGIENAESAESCSSVSMIFLRFLRSMKKLSSLQRAKIVFSMEIRQINTNVSRNFSLHDPRSYGGWNFQRNTRNTLNGVKQTSVSCEERVGGGAIKMNSSLKILQRNTTNSFHACHAFHSQLRALLNSRSDHDRRKSRHADGGKGKTRMISSRILIPDSFSTTSRRN